MLYLRRPNRNMASKTRIELKIISDMLAVARRYYGESAWSQIMVGGSNFSELLGATFVFLFTNLVHTPMPWLRLDSLPQARRRCRHQRRGRHHLRVSHESLWWMKLGKFPLRGKESCMVERKAVAKANGPGISAWETTWEEVKC